MIPLITSVVNRYVQDSLKNNRIIKVISDTTITKIQAPKTIDHRHDIVSSPTAKTKLASKPKSISTRKKNVVIGASISTEVTAPIETLKIHAPLKEIRDAVVAESNRTTKTKMAKRTIEATEK